MYGSYGSYSSMYSSSSDSTPASSPMDISSSGMRSDNTTCAYPSWPRRSALSGSSCTEQRASSYLSDDDLFPQDLEEDDARSVSSSGSSVASPEVGQQLAEMERQRQAAMQREYVRMLISEKERRKQAAKKSRRTSSSGGSSKKSSRRTSTMTPIVENGE